MIFPTTFLWVAVAILVLLGGAKESDFARGQIYVWSCARRQRSRSPRLKAVRALSPHPGFYLELGH